MAHKKKRKGPSGTELNLAAMLDMAFQLLTFFILTFKPAPMEGQVLLRMPPPQPVTGAKGGPTAGQDFSDPDAILQSLNTLTISVFGRGSISSLAVAGTDLGNNINSLDAQLRKVLSDPANPFEQVIIQVDPELHYDQLMRVVDICTKQKLPNGDKLTKLSFVEAGPSR